MGEHEAFSFQLRHSDSPATTKSAELALITLERAQKLDLLIHLLANLRQSLVICGPQGIGKTTLLTALKQRKQDVWLILTIKATSGLSFESIQGQIRHFVRQGVETSENQAFSTILSDLERQNQKLVILVERAGQLVPGLISALVQDARISPSIRLVFSLTHDELQIKTQSDQAIDDCHFIEMPALTQNQCEVFLQQLSRQPKAIVAFNAINERMIARLYQKTQGNPGKLMTELAALSNNTTEHGLKWGRGVFLAVLITVGMVFFRLNDTDEISKQGEVDAGLVLSNAGELEILAPVLQSSTAALGLVSAIKQKVNDPALSRIPVSALESVASHEKEQAPEAILLDQPGLKKQPLREINTTKASKAANVVIKAADTEPPASIQEIGISSLKVRKVPDEVLAVKKAVNISKDENTIHSRTVNSQSPMDAILVDDSEWVLEQAEKQYTIQLMVLSRRQSVLDFVNHNKSLQDELRYFKINRLGKRLFVLVYGSYELFETASEEMKSLPVKYRKSWVRRFSGLQKSINNKQ